METIRKVSIFLLAVICFLAFELKAEEKLIKTNGKLINELPSNWTELIKWKGSLVIPLHCGARTARINIVGSQIYFKLGQETIVRKVANTEMPETGTYIIYFSDKQEAWSSINVEYKKGSAIGLWKGIIWKNYIFAADNYLNQFKKQKLEKCEYD